jgi:hypothetical protein
MHRAGNRAASASRRPHVGTDAAALLSTRRVATENMVSACLDIMRFMLGFFVFVELSVYYSHRYLLKQMVTSRDNKGHIATDATYSVWMSLWRELTRRAGRYQDRVIRTAKGPGCDRISNQKIFYFVLSSQESKIPRGRNKIWRTSHFPPNFHLTSYFQAHPRCLVSSSPVAAVGRCACVIPHAGSVASLPPRSVCRRRV